MKITEPSLISISSLNMSSLSFSLKGHCKLTWFAFYCMHVLELHQLRSGGGSYSTLTDPFSSGKHTWSKIRVIYGYKWFNAGIRFRLETLGDHSTLGSQLDTAQPRSYTPSLA